MPADAISDWLSFLYNAIAEMFEVLHEYGNRGCYEAHLLVQATLCKSPD